MIRMAKETSAKKTCCCCEGRHKDRSEKELKELTNRLSRIEGQIRGIRRMLDEGAYCVDILTQVSAARCSLSGFTKELLAEHIRTCVANDIREGSDEKIEELVALMPKLMK